MRQLRVGIIGCGGRGREHAIGYAASPDVRIVAVADPVAAAAQKLGKEYGAEGVFDDYRQMLAAGPLDIVSICTWTGQHHQQMLDSIAAGAKAINCEKPMAPTYGEALAMHRACEAAGVQATYCHQRRFEAQFWKARELARGGAIGKIQRVEGSCPNLFDWGTHWFDMFFYYNDEVPAEWVMGQVDLEGAHTVFAVPVEGSGLSLIHFANGVEGLLVTGHDAWEKCANRIIGSEGIIELGRCDGSSLSVLRAGHNWEQPSLEGVVPAGGDTTLSMLDSIECLKTGREPMLGSRKALQATELIFATYESARRRAKVKLPLDITGSPLQAMISEAGLQIK